MSVLIVIFVLSVLANSYVVWMLRQPYRAVQIPPGVPETLPVPVVTLDWLGLV